ncbi:1-acyl-sn-glycerol-3-phosphate acyltransferase [Fulvivirga maritima]|uniref:lysophospholipid acyltransferase family protein n=1 Tax=Fulvivirga maritima TaxID=2904247 RepID=UPI001F2BEA1D|nr:lysophospholipid acyltransferase family protein [Fulvivirga maritima]UII26522.1 1-acyl-sn-glycerol-3-phosphate acyltransferase [Fulvivirga maritima]
MMLTLITQVIFWLKVGRFYTRVKMRHLRSITGVENLPESGPFIVVANHSSYVDHYFIGALFKHLYNSKVFFLTKKESFQSWWDKLWLKSANAIPVDREKPDIAAFKTMLKVLGEKNILVIYPEGTRGPGDEMLPFKSGAFRIASKMRVPIVPIGLVGVHKIMSREETKFSKEKASLNIGKPISIDSIKQLSASELMEYTRQRIFELSHAPEKPHELPENLLTSCDALANKVERRIEEVLESCNYSEINIGYKQQHEAIDYAMINHPNHVSSIVQKARLIGIKALASKRDFLFRMGTVKRLAKQALSIDPEHAFAHYILGQYYLKFPDLLGGSALKAMKHLSLAFQNAPLYGIEQSKFTFSLAEAYEKAGDAHAALKLLQFQPTAQGVGKRFENRQLKIKNKVTQLEALLIKA